MEPGHGFRKSWGYGETGRRFYRAELEPEADRNGTPRRSQQGTLTSSATWRTGWRRCKARAPSRLALSTGFPLREHAVHPHRRRRALENFRGATDASAKVYQFGANGLVGFNLGFGGVALRCRRASELPAVQQGKLDSSALGPASSFHPTSATFSAWPHRDSLRRACSK